MRMLQSASTILGGFNPISLYWDVTVCSFEVDVHAVRHYSACALRPAINSLMEQVRSDHASVGATTQTG
eukprot:1161976-Pelagomonas_calceolata.AAC.7